MRCSRWSLEGFVWPVCLAVVLAGVPYAAAQNADALSPFFEGKQVVVKMDMPGTQKGVDIYPNRQPPLDAKSYGDRLKQFGVSLQKGDTVMVTKVKVNKDNVEFQLGGGGYGTARDSTDTAVHFTPGEKSSREKDLENQISNESDPDRRRSLQRELDRVRSDRERRDAYNHARAEDDAARRTDQLGMKRQQGGSRFNIKLDARTMEDSLTPQVIESALAEYVSFPGDAAGANGGGVPVGSVQGGGPGLAVRGADNGFDPAQSLKKGMTREQVEGLYGPAVEAHDRTENGMSMTSCTYQSKDEKVQADFVNGVLVQYSVSSR
ncbi:hypothetical protein [Tunturibacter empetritectus]|uniref:Uncharacterized protein n=1 Tax=Tunturiibacter lichenicola TaxID=2051959 RepID=A0A7W8N316_9BACT|nr:hypothetical protein [Edaphobacter lichenicola]MBB5343654.1 hypothetical protein [Edaphobacter lichenicola]